jgi:hypothetical protein
MRINDILLVNNAYMKSSYIEVNWKEPIVWDSLIW